MCGHEALVHRLPAFAGLLLALCACSRETDVPTRGEVDLAVLERSKACHRASSESLRKILEDENSKPVEAWLTPEAIISKRRHYEGVCLEEARCLGINQLHVGLYLKDCLKTLEGGT